MTLVTIVHNEKSMLIPLIFNFKNRIDKHILIYDTAKEDIKTANELKSSIETLNKTYKITATIKTFLIDEDSKEDLLTVKDYLQKEGGKKVFLNAAGADTALLVILSSFTLDIGGSVLAYDKQDNNYNIITQNGFVNQTVETNMTIDDFLILMGEKLVEEESVRDILKRKEALMTIFGDSKRMFKMRRLLSQGEAESVYQNYQEILAALKTLDIIDDTYRFKDNSKFSKFGRYFEEFIYLHLKEFDFDDIKVGIKIIFESESQGEGEHLHVRNEFDILTIKENRIGVVECKIGKNIDPLATVYKSDALMGYFGSDSRSLIINIQPQQSHSPQGGQLNFSSAFLLRASHNRIGVFNAFELGKQKFAKTVEKVFGVKKRID
jgi:hypothetical protein